MTPADPARLAVVFIPLAIVVGAAGYGIGRGIQDNDRETRENAGGDGCKSHIEQFQRAMDGLRDEEGVDISFSSLN